MKIIYSRLLSGLCGLFCAALGMVVLIGWHTGNAFLVTGQSGFMPMQYLTALCFLLSGAGVVSHALRLPRFLPIVPGALTGGLGILMCATHLTGWSMGFTALLRHLPEIAGVTANISAAPTAAGLVLMGTGVLLLGLPIRMKTRRLLVWMLGASAGAVGLTVFWAYSLGATMVFMSGSPLGMAIHSSCGLMVLGAGLLSAQWPGLGRLVDHRWLPAPFGMAAIVGTLTLWQELAADRSHTLGNQAEVTARNAAAGTRGRFTYCVRSLNRIRERWEESAAPRHPGPVRDARACLQDEPFFEVIGHADAGLRVDWAEADREADSWRGRSLRDRPQWDAGPALEDSIKNRRMLVSPIHPLRTNDAGLMIFLPVFSGDKFLGGLFGVLRLQDLPHVPLEHPPSSACRISIFEGDRLVWGGPPAEPAGPGLQAESKLEFGGRVWRFVAEPESTLPGGNETPVMILWMGGLLGAAMGGAVGGFQQTALRGRMAGAANEQLRAQMAERHLVERRMRRASSVWGRCWTRPPGFPSSRSA
ncbi:MAG: sensor signal transduction histidine kinase [Verrucomicrobiales bacterium]|nr:sensor signal transduction histidine kinase [Verrucomicrobiales bacterium]